MAATVASTKELFFVELNADADETIVLIHGLLSSHLEYAEVTPQLAKYHLLLVDANGHSGSREIGPVTIQASADNVASLIRGHAHNGVAHLVGLSFGGHVALELSRRYGDLVKSAFITGAVPFEGVNKWMASHPAVVWYLMAPFLSWFPEWLYLWSLKKKGLRDNYELYAAMRRNFRWEVVRDGFSSILLNRWEELGAIKVPTLILAAELEDDVAGTKRAGPLLRDGGDERSRAVKVKGALHPWDLQLPELFAQSVVAWIEGTELPVELEEL